jgi:hypothetical protein
MSSFGASTSMYMHMYDNATHDWTSKRQQRKLKKRPKLNCPKKFVRTKNLSEQKNLSKQKICPNKKIVRNSCQKKIVRKNIRKKFVRKKCPKKCPKNCSKKYCPNIIFVRNIVLKNCFPICSRRCYVQKSLIFSRGDCTKRVFRRQENFVLRLLVLINS